MKNILCFGDSNTYGYIPKDGSRYPWGVRWTSILSEKLGLKDYQVIEEGLVGRTTVFDDPLRDYRNGAKQLPAVLETHGAVDIVVVMLGTNDCKTVYGATAEVIGKGVQRLIGQIRHYTPQSKILLISPIHFGTEVWREEFDPEFSQDSIRVNNGLAAVYRKIADHEGIWYLDASAYAEPSSADQEHLDERGHRELADGIYKKICEIEAA